MTTFQKIIKYLAMAFALCLVVAIIYGILNAIYGLFGLVRINGKEEVDDNYSYAMQYDNTFTTLDVDLKYTSLTIYQGDNFEVKHNNKRINISQDGSKLTIVENGKPILINKNLKSLELYIPKNTNFEIMDIQNGAGEVLINGVNTNNLKLELGAGKTSINNIIARESNIDAGAGSVNISNCELNNLKLDLGVGEVNFDGKITGNSSINSGIGEVNITLNVPSSEYTFDFNKGIGAITLNGTSVANDSIIGSGTNYLKIDGGIGSIKVKTLN